MHMPEILGLALGPLIVTIIRLLVPFTIFRWNLWGGLAATIVDALDVVMITAMGLGDFDNYHNVDKILDWYFLLFMAIVAIKWKSVEKISSLSLFGWRTIGVIVFELTKIRATLVVFPNLFLWWWLFVAARDKYFPDWELNWKRAIIVLLILLVPKMAQELTLHYFEAQPWNWTKEHILRI